MCAVLCMAHKSDSKKTVKSFTHYISNLLCRIYCLGNETLPKREGETFACFSNGSSFCSFKHF